MANPFPIAGWTCKPSTSEVRLLSEKQGVQELRDKLGLGLNLEELEISQYHRLSCINLPNGCKLNTQEGNNETSVHPKYLYATVDCEQGCERVLQDFRMRKKESAGAYKGYAAVVTVSTQLKIFQATS